MAMDERVRVAAIGDLHFTKASHGTLALLFAQISRSADVLAMCGDLTDHGLPEEAHVLAKELTGSLKIPAVAVLGNHDYEVGKASEICDILCEAEVTMLNGDACELRGVGFAGVRGFGGGFGRYALSAWGEDTVKRFVHEAVDEALKLESALIRLRTANRIALLHYSPIQATVEGEPPEIYPYLGSSRLEDPLLRMPVTAVFHGHAHHGRPRGQLHDGVPVYNVSLPLLRREFPDRPPFHLLELTAGDSADPADSADSADAAGIPNATTGTPSSS